LCAPHDRVVGWLVKKSAFGTFVYRSISLFTA
jgi:hypothetical protein